MDHALVRIRTLRRDGYRCRALVHRMALCGAFASRVGVLFDDTPPVALCPLHASEAGL